MTPVNLIIDGKNVKANDALSLLEAAESVGINIPKLCNHADLEPYGGCRLCLVEIEGVKGLTAACTTKITEGMIVHTKSELLNRVRAITIEMLLADCPSDCASCSSNQRCELQGIAFAAGITHSRFARISREASTDMSSPFFSINHSKCILCARCTRTCNEITCVGAIDMAFRADKMKVAVLGDKPWLDSICGFCGECVERCPVGALSPKQQEFPTREVATICPYCGVGCGIHLGTRSGRVISVRGNRDNAVNKGKLCVKGRYGIIEFVNHPERLRYPLIRRNGKLERATWNEALNLIEKKIRSYAPDEVAVISSAKCTNEENYVIQKFTRAVLGTNNIDHCARLCHAPSISGLMQSFGSGGMTNSIRDMHMAACILAIGTNTTATHPVIGMELKMALRKGTKLIVVNPREIDLCRYADIWLRLRPGTDVALLMGLMHIIEKGKLADIDFIRNHCENYDAFTESLKDFTPQKVEDITGVPMEQLFKAARLYATSKPAVILYAMGITQHSHGTDNVIATANLAMMTGNIGKPGSGLDPLRGQNNVQGACDMGALPDVFPGYQKVNDADMRRKFELAWDCKLNTEPGLTLTEIFKAASQKKLKSLFMLIGENPLLSEPDINYNTKALCEMDFVVAQDIFLSETAEMAHVVLPAASFAEKDGTFTNTERRIQRIRRAISPVGESKTDWEIICMIARKMNAKGFDYTGPSQIMDEIASLTPIYGGISYERLEQGGLQWPCPTLMHSGTPILHINQFTRGKGYFIPLAYKPSAELPDMQYPLILTTERSLYHYHTGTMTRRIHGLNSLKNHETVEINPFDAEKRGIQDNDKIKVISRRGEVAARALVTEASPPGVITMSFHFAESPTNTITSPALDPVAKIPELKVCAVDIKKI